MPTLTFQNDEFFCAEHGKGYCVHWTKVFKTRSEEEIQRAHDQLTGILITKQLRRDLDNQTRDLLVAACDVLCWVLKHEHNQTFAKALKMFEAWAESYGYEISQVKPN